MTTTLFTGGDIRSPAAVTPASWLLVDGDRIAGAGDASDRPAADRVVDIGGATLVPGFCDAHVHLPATGLAAAGMDLREVRSVDEITALFARRAEAGELLFGSNFEDPLDRPVTRRDLDRAVGDRPALLARADMHSCVASTTLLEGLALDGVDGVDRDSSGVPTGYLREQAAGAAWVWFDANLPAAEQRQAIETAVQLAYSKGVTRVHEMYVVEWRGWTSLGVMNDVLAGVALQVDAYVASTDVERVRALGLPRVGGDLFLDGSFGSHTAWLAEPYVSQPPSGAAATGTRYRTDEELTAFFSEAQRLEMQCGVHAIGDAAIEQALRCWEAVAATAGVGPVRALGHRIEHFECATDDHIRRAGHLGLRASVQPAFDGLWGGEGGLYALRIGWERASNMNRFGSMKKASLLIGAGSDSTVTPLDPLVQMHSLRTHHVDAERIGSLDALGVHTAGSHALADGASVRGRLQEGDRADLVVLDRDPVTASDDDLLKTEVLGTWVGGRQVWPPDLAEVR